MRRSRAVASADQSLAAAETLLASIKSDIAGSTGHRVSSGDGSAGAIMLEWEHRAGQRRRTSSSPPSRSSLLGRSLRLIGWALIAGGVAAGSIFALAVTGDGRETPVAQSEASVQAAASGQPQAVARAASHRAGPADAEPVLPPVFPDVLPSRSLPNAPAPTDRLVLQSAASATLADGTAPEADPAGLGENAALQSNAPHPLGPPAKRSTVPRSSGADVAGARNTKWTASFFDRAN